MGVETFLTPEAFLKTVHTLRVSRNKKAIDYVKKLYYDLFDTPLTKEDFAQGKARIYYQLKQDCGIPLSPLEEYRLACIEIGHVAQCDKERYKLSTQGMGVSTTTNKPERKSIMATKKETKTASKASKTATAPTTASKPSKTPPKAKTATPETTTAPSTEKKNTSVAAYASRERRTNARYFIAGYPVTQVMRYLGYLGYRAVHARRVLLHYDLGEVSVNTVARQMSEGRKQPDTVIELPQKVVKELCKAAEDESIAC